MKHIRTGDAILTVDDSVQEVFVGPDRVRFLASSAEEVKQFEDASEAAWLEWDAQHLGEPRPK